MYISIRRWCRHAHGGFCLGGPTVRTSACQTEDTGSTPVQGSIGTVMHASPEAIRRWRVHATGRSLTL